MEPAEVEFLAEKEQITIVPNFSENKLYLISGEFGPFNPSMQTRVPLWLAINLRQRQKCHIVPPDWLNVDYLTEKKSEEAAESFFTAMPSPNYMEVSSLVLNNAAEDVPKADEVRTLVKDIWDLRQAKLKKGVDQMISQQETFAKLDNLTLMEMNCIRPFLTAALDHLHLLHNHATSYTSSQAD
ncbi:DNA replication complex GINS protein PSF2 [Geodia barretti]|uniref:DNA replication complex GINS protein PSF2 n=1 Tax=Geodia barretti TaxID=519541 RepID=A0AA35RTP2_GEOBA|nr:DNA replication complex GINS protein PSF2 [Geodia barretti]